MFLSIGGVWLEVQVDNSRDQSWVVHVHPPFHLFAVMSWLISGLLPVLFNSMLKGMRTRKGQGACETMESFSHDWKTFVSHFLILPYSLWTVFIFHLFINGDGHWHLKQKQENTHISYDIEQKQ